MRLFSVLLVLVAALALNGQTIASGQQFQRAVFAADRDIQLTVRRAGEDEPLQLPVQLAGQPLRLGISWREDAAEPGSVVLTRVVPGSPADHAALRPGDRILGINEMPIRDGQELQQRVAALPSPLRLTIERDGRLREVEIGAEDSRESISIEIVPKSQTGGGYGTLRRSNRPQIFSLPFCGARLGDEGHGTMIHGNHSQTGYCPNPLSLVLKRFFDPPAVD